MENLTLSLLILTQVAVLEGRVFRFSPVAVSLVTCRGRTKRRGKALHKALYTWEGDHTGALQYVYILQYVLSRVETKSKTM